VGLDIEAGDQGGGHKSRQAAIRAARAQGERIPGRMLARSSAEMTTVILLPRYGCFILARCWSPMARRAVSSGRPPAIWT